jgi:hypothetical protein
MITKNYIDEIGLTDLKILAKKLSEQVAFWRMQYDQELSGKRILLERLKQKEASIDRDGLIWQVKELTKIKEILQCASIEFFELLEKSQLEVRKLEYRIAEMKHKNKKTSKK